MCRPLGFRWVVQPCCLEFEQAAQRNNRVIETGILGSLLSRGGNNKKISAICTGGPALYVQITAASLHVRPRRMKKKG